MYALAFLLDIQIQNINIFLLCILKQIFFNNFIKGMKTLNVENFYGIFIIYIIFFHERSNLKFKIHFLTFIFPDIFY